MAWIKYALALSLLASIITAKTSTKYKVENIFQGVGLLSESPLWVNEEGALYWVDTESQDIFRLEVGTGFLTKKHIEYGRVSLLARVKDYPKLLAISVRTSVFFLNWDTFKDDNSLRLITTVDPGLPNNRIDDGKVDAKGRFWFGTMGREQNAVYDKDLGSVYLMTANNYKSPDLKIKPVSISNGIAWSSDNKRMFYVDSGSRAVVVYDFNLETGGIENGRTLFSFEKRNLTGFPDGMTIDRDDNLWVACYLGGQVIKVDSNTGKLLKEYKLPTTRITSVMWGGPDYSTLYVTSASKDFTESELEQQPEAGAVFAITGTGSSGFPMNEFIFKDADIY